MKVRKLGARRGGFTLLEMVVVLGILVALAGLVVAKLDVFGMKANKGVAASNMVGISRHVQTYRVQKNIYPDNWDSLLDNSGATPVLWKPGAPGTTPGLDPQTVGGPPAASPTKLKVDFIATDKELRSLGRMGITTALDLDTASTDLPGNRFTTSRTLAFGAALSAANAIATINEADGDGAAIVKAIYPATGAIPAGKKLAVFGLGKLNQLVGSNSQSSLLMEAPLYSNTNATQYYNRFLVVFEYDTGGSRARMVYVLGSDGDRIDEEIADYVE